MFGRFGPVEALLILAVVLVIFGPKKLPEIGSAIGKAIQNFRDGFKKKADGGEPKSVDASKDDKPDSSLSGRS